MRKQWMPVLFALLLTAAGAAMPRLVSALQDAAVENQRENRLLNAVQITLLQDGGIRETLRLMAEGPTLPWTGSTAMSEDEAAAAARKMLDLLLADGLIPEPKQTSADLPYGREYIEPRIVLSTDDSRSSAIVWLYTYTGDKGSAGLYMDDATGQMVRMRAFVNGDPNPETYSELAEDWRLFLTEYYGFELLPDNGGQPFLEENLDRRRFPLLLDMGDRREPCRLDLTVYDFMMITFNF